MAKDIKMADVKQYQPNDRCLTKKNKYTQNCSYELHYLCCVCVYVGITNTCQMTSSFMQLLNDMLLLESIAPLSSKQLTNQTIKLSYETM